MNLINKKNYINHVNPVMKNPCKSVATERKDKT